MKRNTFKCLVVSILLVWMNFAIAAESGAQQAYYNWCKAIGTARGNPKVVVQYYAPGAVLIPTLSADFLVNTNNGLDAYFKKLTSKPNLKCTPKKLVTHIRGGIATNTGFYDFSFTKNGETIVIPARFTFVYKKSGDRWLITSHHSSKMPQ